MPTVHDNYQDHDIARLPTSRLLHIHERCNSDAWEERRSIEIHQGQIEDMRERQHPGMEIGTQRAQAAITRSQEWLDRCETDIANIEAELRRRHVEPPNLTRGETVEATSRTRRFCLEIQGRRLDKLSARMVEDALDKYWRDGSGLLPDITVTLYYQGRKVIACGGLNASRPSVVSQIMSTIRNYGDCLILLEFPKDKAVFAVPALEEQAE